MTWGSKADALCKAAERAGHPVPAFMEEKVEVPTRLMMFWVAWHSLTTCRNDGYVPWTAIDAYARRYDYTQEEFHILVRVCRILDDTVQELANKEQ